MSQRRSHPNPQASGAAVPMTRTLANKVIVPMAVIILVSALGVSWALSWLQARRERDDAQGHLVSVQADLMDLLDLTQSGLASRMDAEMKLLQGEARRMGLARRGPEVRAGAESVPDLRFGGASQAELMARVQSVLPTSDAVISIFSLRGQDLVRVSTTAFLPDGTQAVGTRLDPASAAGLALAKGRSYWGPSSLFGTRHYAYYEPIRDAAGRMIGAFGLGIPLARLTRIYQSIHRARIPDHGFVALVEPDGRPLFSGGGMLPDTIREVYRTGRANGEPWSVRRQPFAPWGVSILAAYPERDLEKEVLLIRGGAMALALLLVAALTGSSFYVLRKNLLRPLGEVLASLDRIAQGEQFGLRFASGGEGEIGALEGSLNRLLDHIQARDRKLLEYQEHLEDLVARRLDQLRDTQQLLAATLDALPAAIAILDGEGLVLLNNQQWSLFSGSSHPLFSGTGPGTAYLPLCQALQSADGDAGTAAAQLAELIQGRRGSLSLDCGLVLEGQAQWFTILAIRFGTADRPRTVMMWMDVTEQRRMEDQLRQAQKLESIGQLAAGIAHEINTPTQYIGDNTLFLQEAFTDLWRLVEAVRSLLEVSRDGRCPPGPVLEARRILEEADLDFLEKEIPKALGECREGVRRVTRIVSAMKDFSHPGDSRKSPIDLNRAIESTALVCRSEWKYLADLELDLDPELPPVPCLADEINQVVLNLIINASQAIAEAGRETKGLIGITTRREGGHAHISVADTGGGIPEAIRSRVFDPFFTTKPVGKGTGQGLSIAHSVIVERHGGSIDLESEVGKGTTFHLRLPLESAPGAAAGGRSA